MVKDPYKRQEPSNSDGLLQKSIILWQPPPKPYKLFKIFQFFF